MEVRVFGPRIVIKTLRLWESFREYLGCCRYRFHLGWFRLTVTKFI
jgi:hypothetical protein